MKGLRISVVTPEGDGRPGAYSVSEFSGGLEELQRAVGGHVEPIPTNNIVTMWVHDEGKFVGLPINRLAMDVWIRWDDYRCMTVGRDWLAGDVVVTGGVDDRTGKTLDLTEVARRWVLAVATDAGAAIA